MKLRRTDLLAAAGGAAIGVCWLPLGLSPLMPLSLYPAMIGIRRTDTWREALRFGLFFGAARYAVAAHFLLALLAWSPLAIVIYGLAIVFILPFSAVEALGAWWLERRAGIPRPYGLAFGWVVMEKVRAWGDLSFPADLLSHAFGRHPAWLAWEPWTGPFGLTLLVVLGAALVESAWARRAAPRRAAPFAAAAAALWLGPPLTDLVSPPPAPSGPELRVAVVQPSVTLDDKLRRERWPAMRERLEAMTLAAARGADLVVWPESARPGPLVWDASKPFGDPVMEELAAKAGVPILYGCDIARMRDGSVEALFNGAALARPDGRPGGWYAKQHLLPLVEGIPFAKAFGLDPAKRRRDDRRGYLTLLGNFTPGGDPFLFEVGPARIGVLICYESFYPELSRAYRAHGANALVVLTNDAWWGWSVFPRWHAAMIAARAREQGLPVVRAANNGVSSSVGADGRTTEATGLYEITVLRTRLVPAPVGRTLYTTLGDWPVWLVLAFCGVASIRGRGAG